MVHQYMGATEMVKIISNVIANNYISNCCSTNLIQRLENTCTQEQVGKIPAHRSNGEKYLHTGVIGKNAFTQEWGQKILAHRNKGRKYVHRNGTKSIFVFLDFSECTIKKNIGYYINISISLQPKVVKTIYFKQKLFSL